MQRYFTLTRDPTTGEPIPAREFEFDVTFKHERRYEYTDNVRGIQKRDGILLLVDDIGLLEEREFGLVEAVGSAGSGYNRRVLNMEVDQFLSKGAKHTILHEEGHREGLGHLHSRENIMSYRHNSYKVLPQQQQEIGESMTARVMTYLINRSGFDRNNFIIRFNYGNPAQFDIQEELNEIKKSGGDFANPEK